MIYNERDNSLLEFIISVCLAVAVIQSIVIWSVMLVDDISPKELSQCLDRHAPSPTNSSK